MKKIAVVLSGCGVMDGSEIHEATLTLLTIAKAGASYQCLAPNIMQPVVNHLTNETVANEQRNVLQEAARFSRGDILPIDKAKPEDYQAVIFPGGYGVGLNLTNFAAKGAAYQVNKEVLQFAKAMAQAGKPAGFMCLAGILINKIYGAGVHLTLGKENKIVQMLIEEGAKHTICTAEEIIVDEQHKVVSTPAYMVAESIAELQPGIEKLAQKVIALI